MNCNQHYISELADAVHQARCSGDVKTKIGPYRVEVFPNHALFSGTPKWAKEMRREDQQS